MSQTTTSKNLMERWLSTFNFNPVGERKNSNSLKEKEPRCRSYSMTLLNKSGKSIESSTNSSTTQLPTTYVHQGQANGKLTKRSSIEARMAFWTISLLKVKSASQSDIPEEEGYHSDTYETSTYETNTPPTTNMGKLDLFNYPFKYLSTATQLSKSKSMTSNKSQKVSISKEQNNNSSHHFKGLSMPCQRTSCKDCFPVKLNCKAKLNSNSTSTTVTPTLTISSAGSSKALEEMKEMMKLMQLEENSIADFSPQPPHQPNPESSKLSENLTQYSHNHFICQSSDLQMENIDYYADSDSEEFNFSYLKGETSGSPTSSFTGTKPCYIVASHSTD